MPEILIKYADEKIIGVQLVEKSMFFFKKSACSQSLSPNPFPGKGAILGLPPLDPVGGLRPCDPVFI